MSSTFGIAVIAVLSLAFRVQSVNNLSLLHHGILHNIHISSLMRPYEVWSTLAFRHQTAPVLCTRNIDEAVRIITTAITFQMK
jgi:hypothetical protein